MAFLPMIAIVRRKERATSAQTTSGPTQILLAEWKRADSLTGDLENRLRHGWGDLRDRLFAHAGDPFIVGLEELDVDLHRIVRHAGDLEPVEIALDHASVLNGDLLPHCVAERPGDLAFDLLAYRERVNEREALVEHAVDAFESQHALLAHRDRDHFGADRDGLPRRTPAVVDRDAARKTFGERRAPARHFGDLVERLEPIAPVAEIRVPRDQLAPVFVRVAPGGVGEFVDETFKVEDVD